MCSRQEVPLNHSKVESVHLVQVVERDENFTLLGLPLQDGLDQVLCGKGGLAGKRVEHSHVLAVGEFCDLETQSSLADPTGALDEDSFKPCYAAQAGKNFGRVKAWIEKRSVG